VSGTDHRDQLAAAVRVAILTVSDTRTKENDHSGRAIHRLVTGAGHLVVEYHLLRDEPDSVRECVQAWCARGYCDAILINGGTGLANRDTTIEAVATLFAKQIDGFGELFRMLSFADIGANAMLSRAIAGTCGNIVIFCMPGSTAAVTLAMEKLILPALPHVTALVRPGHPRPCQRPNVVDA